jgi:transcriptional regulator with XRE-family HTH domain
MNVQERIKELMDFKGWSDYRLSKEADLPQSTISHLFKRNNAPTYSTIEAICRAFGITVAQFFAETGEATVLTEEQWEVIRLYGVLTEDQKQVIKRTMRYFSGE